jgi:hypothetical protein
MATIKQDSSACVILFFLRYSVEFTLTGHGPFILEVPSNVSNGNIARVFVNRTGGLDYETTREYKVRTEILSCC